MLSGRVQVAGEDRLWVVGLWDAATEGGLLTEVIVGEGEGMGGVAVSDEAMSPKLQVLS